MKILHVIPSLRKGGAERLAIDICRELRQREGIEVKLIVLHDENEYQFLSGELNVIKCNSYFSYHILRSNEADFSQYRSIVESFKPDVIHSHLFEAEFFTRACLFPGVTYFSHLHDNMPQFENFSASTLSGKEKLTRWLEKRRLIRNYEDCRNSFIANSEDTGNYFKAHLPDEFGKNLTVLPNAVELSHFPFVSRSWTSQEIRLVTTGSLVEKKNHLFLLDVVKQLKTSGRKIHLNILGDGPLKNELEKRIDELDIQAEVNLQGNVDDVAHYLHEAQVYVHVATYEPFGLAIVEGMATGLPVVCLNGGGNREIIDNGSNGFLLNEQNPKTFADKILEIVRDEQNYQKFSEAAGKKAEASDIKKYTDQLLELYNTKISISANDSKKNQRHLKWLDSLRAIAAFSVIVSHLEYIKSVNSLPSLEEFPYFKFTGGSVGVILFFVLSGFLITLLLLKEKDSYGRISFQDFYLRRIFRIWPLYYFVLIVSVLVFSYMPGTKTAILNATLLPNVAFALNMAWVPNPVIWSIGVEEQFYLAWPFLINFLKRKLLPILIIFFIGYSLLPHAILFILVRIFPDDQLMKFVNRFFESSLFNSMAVGGIAAILYLRKSRILNIFQNPIVMLLGIILPFVLWISGFHFQYFTFEFYSLLFAFLLLAVTTNKSLNRIGEPGLLKFLGKISYGLYMYHWMVILLVVKTFQNQFRESEYGNLFPYLISIILTVVVASISYYLIERKFLNLKNKFTRI